MCRAAAHFEKVARARKRRKELQEMKIARFCKVAGYAASGGVLLQLTACYGSDPQFYFTSTITNIVLSNLISALFGAFFSASA